MSHATQVALTNVDSEKHRLPLVTLNSVAASINAIGPSHTILSSDSGSHLLAPPIEAFREFLLMIRSAGFGFSDDDMRLMSATNPRALFLDRHNGPPESLQRVA